MPLFRFGATEAEIALPPQFPDLIEAAEDWDQFASFKRQLASRFQITDFGSEKMSDGSFILFPLEKKQDVKPKKDDFEAFLRSHVVFSELSAKSAELFELMTTQKKKFAESQDFLKYSRIGMMRLISQMIVLRKEVAKQEVFAPILNAQCIPISEMGDLERSAAVVSLRQALDFIVQQGLTVLGAQKFYDDLLAHWNDLVPFEEKQTRDHSGAAPFWAAQKDKFTEMTHHLRDWPEFGATQALTSRPTKDSLLWYGKEALTDSSVKFQERQAAIRTAYHSAFKAQRKHASLCQEAFKETKKVKIDAKPPTPSLPTAPKPPAALIPTLSAPRTLFSPGSRSPSKNPRRRPFFRPPPTRATFRPRPRKFLP